MKHNIWTTDKIIRISLAVLIAVLWYLNIISGPLAIVLLTVAGGLIFTSLVGFCGIYTLFWYSSCPIQKK